MLIYYHTVRLARLNHLRITQVAYPAADAVLLDSLLLFEPHSPHGGSATGRARSGRRHWRNPDADVDAVVRLLARAHGRDLALCDRASADLLRQRLHRQARLLEI